MPAGRPAAELPATAAWRHVDARAGFEVLFLRRTSTGYRFEGHSTAVEDGEAWAVRYAVEVDRRWSTRSAHVVGRSRLGDQDVRLDHDGSGRWLVAGAPAPHLEGCLDVDLEASAFTNALPVRRLDLDVGEQVDVPAAYVRALDLAVERLDQRYLRLEEGIGGRYRYRYSAPRFGYEDTVVCDELGLVVDYPGLAVRVA